MAQGNIRIAALIACHNRKLATLSCLQDLSEQGLPNFADLDVIVVDDGSTDGTADAIKRDYNSVVLVHGDGQLFWGGGMRLAFEKASELDYDFYLWVNDDVSLHRDAVRKLIKVNREQNDRGERSPIVVGVLSDPDDQTTAYGGWQSVSKLFPARMRRLEAQDFPELCDCANGNFVLIPSEAAKAVGNIDPQFVHRAGDFDYFMRARKLGFPILTVPGIVGQCRPNRPPMEVALEKKRWRDAWQHYTSIKGLQPSSWKAFNKRHGGILWPLAFISPYFKFWLKAFTRNRRTE